MTEIIYKTCTKCSETKSTTEFHSSNGKPVAACKACAASASRERYIKRTANDLLTKSPQELEEKRRLGADRALAYYNANIDKCREKSRIKAEKTRRNNGAAIQQKLTKDEFIKRSIESHPESTFDYSKSVIDGTAGSTTIICHKGHEFNQMINHHMRGGACPYCSHSKMNTQSFKERALEVHPQGGFDYSEVVYKNSNSKVKITCKHGHSFWQTPNAHLSGDGCLDCANIAMSVLRMKDSELFISQSKLAHAEAFDYSLTEYKGDSRDIWLTCPKGHTFSQKAGSHLKGIGCPHCMESGYNIDKQGSIYLLSAGDITKVGITNRPVSVRLKEIRKSSGKDFVEIFSATYDDGCIAHSIEYGVKHYLKALHEPMSEKFDGYTESFFNVDNKMLIKNIETMAQLIQGTYDDH